MHVFIHVGNVMYCKCNAVQCNVCMQVRRYKGINIGIKVCRYKGMEVCRYKGMFSSGDKAKKRMGL